jgi:hypothetical protein
MNVKILLVLPIAVVGLFTLFASKQKERNERQQQGIQPSAVAGSSNFGKNGANVHDHSDKGFLESIRKSQDQRTQGRYELAERESHRDIENYPSRDSFLLTHFASTFDSWKLSSSVRSAIVKAVGNYNNQSAIAFRDSARSWPLAVGDVANTTANQTHQLALLQAIKDLKSTLHSELTSAAGVKFANEFMAKNYPSRELVKAKAVLID